MRDALGAFIGAQTNSPVRVTDLRRITVGHSRAMYHVECSDGARYVLRMEQGGVFGTSSIEEFGVMRWLHVAGVPVANVRWFEATGATLGQPFFIMDFIPGAEGADERSVDEATARSFVRVLLDLHHRPFDASTGPFAAIPASPDDATRGQIERWGASYRSASTVPIPLLEEAAAWLHRNAPPLARMTVVHGDAGPGNFVHGDGAVVAITDWEFAHLATRPRTGCSALRCAGRER